MSPPPYPFSVGIVAPPGWNVPDLADLLARRLSGLLVRVRREQPVALAALMGEPVCDAAHEVADRFGWLCAMVPVHDWHPRRVALHRAGVWLAATSDALVIVHGPGPLPPDLARLEGLCPWLGTAVRTVRVEAAAAGSR